MGSSFDRYCQAFLHLHVDGWLLGTIGDAELRDLCGVEEARARAAIMDQMGR